ncbi:ATP-binding cassette sub-family A member 17-like [Drosophila obscura]|uniref:ATP-binding cassette sub-family A member 17-like n=1 Tax=Drosophila obscura TaxID=7282 RepID=UPI001BB1BA31|nr:ATP-binding cassette sub-family A member 17-like [Drosophila obscura]
MLFYVILLLRERGSFCKRRQRHTGGEHPDYCDVQRMTRNELRNHTLLLENAETRHFKSPVRDVTFGLKPMDVLGLVGERSGKTSINKVIVSDINLSSGRVLVKGIDVHSRKINRYKAYKYMGYCPQTDCFESKFTGRENLKIFCLIRGIRAYKVREVSEELAENLNFREHLDKSSGKYTVSDRRKLSTAIAVIGTPPLIILDEPTAGVERAHRSDVLDVLKSVNECGSTILLSSNNIEDFQSLCNRMALLNRGKVIGIGSVESFRNSLKPGLILMVKVRPHAIVQSVRNVRFQPSEQEIVSNITTFLLHAFQTVYLLEKVQGDLLYYINNTTIPLAEAFKIIEQNRHELFISDFHLKHENIELTFVTQNFRILK